jgi:hypothetical protein
MYSAMDLRSQFFWLILVRPKGETLVHYSLTIIFFNHVLHYRHCKTYTYAYDLKLNGVIRSNTEWSLFCNLR